MYWRRKFFQLRTPLLFCREVGGSSVKENPARGERGFAVPVKSELTD